MYEAYFKEFLKLFMDVLRKFKGCLKSFSRVVQGNFKGVSRKVQGGFKEVSSVVLFLTVCFT